ncbi:MAG: hypothetical protein IJ141_00775 [Lachnospiraceae bacterium]|nr:hypothetical protein [Lachnospiraceae bacterium]
MFCKECGFDMPEGTTVCPVCNAPVNNQNQDNQPPKKSFKWWIPLSCVLGAVLVGGGILIGIKIANKNKNDNTTEITEEITTEEQVATPTEATTEAIEETTEEITTEEAPPERVEIAISDIPEQDMLNEFLDKYEHYGTAINNDFDCDNPPDYLLDCLFSPLPIVELTTAPNYYEEDHTSEYGSDPLGKWEWGYRKIGIDGIEWIERNILNLSDEEIARQKNSYFERNDDIYELDGYYYLSSPDTGIGYVGSYHNIVNAKYDGKYYYFIIDDYYIVDYMNNANSISGLPLNRGRYELTMELKEIDGIVFWSIYKCDSLATDWAQAYYNYIYSDNFLFDSSEVSEIAIAYIDDDDIPEIIIYGFSDGGADILSYQNGQVIHQSGSMGVINYIEKGNLLYIEGGWGGRISNILYKIENNEFIVIGEKNEVYDSENTTVTYTWNGVDVTESEYNQNLSETFTNNNPKDMENHKMFNYVSSLIDWLLGQY